MKKKPSQPQVVVALINYLNGGWDFTWTRAGIKFCCSLLQLTYKSEAKSKKNFKIEWSHAWFHITAIFMKSHTSLVITNQGMTINFLLWIKIHLVLDGYFSLARWIVLHFTCVKLSAEQNGLLKIVQANWYLNSLQVFLK